MSTPTSITSEIQKLEPSAVIELFVVDATSVGASVLRFHAGTNALNSDVVWQGETYVKFPVEVTGFEISGQGQIPRPRLKVSNVLSSITTLLLAYQDLIGSKVTRKRTLAKYLDAVNFEGGINVNADATAEFPDDVFFIDRKTVETRDVVEFELSSSLDLAGVKIPRRQVIQNLCQWAYRGSECGYTDTRYFDANDNEVGSSGLDRCGKRLSSCKKRFGPGGDLPFGGFPGAGLFR
jgi:lambda family phage minor tail protein L